MTDDLNTKYLMDQILVAMNETTGHFVGQVNSPTLEQDIKEAVGKTVLDLTKRGLISDSRVGPTVKCLWRTWTLKQKAKWSFYNKVLVIRELTKIAREALEAHNCLVHELHHDDPEGVWVDLPIPDHLIGNPKSIVVCDIMIRPVRELRFVTATITINGDKQ